jgi:hypothetical protein
MVVVGVFQLLVFKVLVVVELGDSVAMCGRVAPVWQE